MERIVCFDLGGVMIKISHTWGAAAERAGVALDAEFGAWGLMDSQSIARFQVGELSVDDYYSSLQAEFKLDSLTAASALHAGILRDAYPGTLKLVVDLHDAGIRTGCLSNTSRPHWQAMNSLERYPNIALLEVPVLSHEVGLEKPDERIYQRFEQDAEMKPTQILFFDDTAINIMAARARGWAAELIDPVQDTAKQMERHIEHWLGK